MSKHYLWLVLNCFLLVGCTQNFKTLKLDKEGLSSSSSLLENKACPIGMYENRGLYRRNSQLLANGLKDVFGDTFLASIQDAITAIPNDNTNGFDFERTRTETNQEQTKACFNLGTVIAEQLIKTPTLLAPFLPQNCNVANALTNPCLDGLFSALLPKVFVSSATPETLNLMKALYTGVQGSAPEKLEVLLAYIFQHPQFLFYDLSEKSSWVIANELARLLWYSFPDEILIQAAKEGKLSEVAEVRKQINRLIADEKARRMVRKFVSQWLKAEKLEELTSYSSSFLSGVVASTALKQAMIDELLNFAEHIVFDNKGTYDDLLTSRLAKVTHPEQAKIYGVTAATNWQELPEARAGILTRTAVLASGENKGNPIMRGVRMTREILCNPIPDPAAELIEMRDLTIDPLALSTRTYNDQRTSGANCMTCHSRINPFGHGLGNFDSIGRHTLTDRIFNPQGAMVRTFDVDAVVDLPLDGRVTRIEGGSELSSAVGKSAQGATCFSLKFAQYLSGMPEIKQNQCGVKYIGANFRSKQPIVQVISMGVEQEILELLK